MFFACPVTGLDVRQGAYIVIVALTMLLCKESLTEL